MPKIICIACRKPYSKTKHNYFCPFNIAFIKQSYGTNDEGAIKLMINKALNDTVNLTIVPDFDIKE